MKYLIIALFLFVTPAMAAPACNSSSLGVVECMGGVMCECGFQRAGSITNDKGSYRWDCGIKRPVCLEYKKIESNNGYQGPNAVGLDKSTETNINSEIGDNSPTEFNINPSTRIKSGLGDDGISTIEIQN